MKKDYKAMDDAGEKIFLVAMFGLFAFLGFIGGCMQGHMVQREASDREWQEKLIEGQHGYYHPETGEFELRELQMIRMPQRSTGEMEA